MRNFDRLFSAFYSSFLKGYRSTEYFALKYPLYIHFSCLARFQLGLKLSKNGTIRKISCQNSTLSELKLGSPKSSVTLVHISCFFTSILKCIFNKMVLILRRVVGPFVRGLFWPISFLAHFIVSNETKMKWFVTQYQIYYSSSTT
jgi:hypothetical protein